MNSMYCTNDLWQLRVRRRRTRFLKADADESGSDAEDWVEAPDPADDDGYGGGGAGGSGGASDAGSGVSLVSWNPIEGGKSAQMAAAAAAKKVVIANPQDREAWQAALDDMQERVLDMKMLLSEAQQRFAAETLARKHAEHERDVALEHESDAKAALEAFKKQAEATAAQQRAEVRKGVLQNVCPSLLGDVAGVFVTALLGISCVSSSNVS